MKEILLIFLLGSLFMACNSNSPNNTYDNSPAAAAPMDGAAPLEAIDYTLTIAPLEEGEADVYGGVALLDIETQETLAFVNTKVGKGAIIINGKEIALNSFQEKEGVYLFEGEGVKVRTTTAQYEEGEEDCIYGDVKEVYIEYKNLERILENIQVQDCAHLGE